jgi:uroporphyrinogen-III synthase
VTAAADQPLAGRRVLVLRAPAQAAALSARIRALGGEPVEAPVLRFEPGDHDRMVAAARELAEGGFAVLCLTSPNGVEALARALVDAGVDADAAADGTLVACVGPGTAAALTATLGIEADLVPDRATTEALGHAIPPGRGRALLARADIANPVLSELLAAKGYEPVEVTAYRTRTASALPDRVLADLAAGRVDLVAFGSSSTVRAFVELVGDRPWRAAAASIGPVTSATCRELGVEVAVEADHHDLDGLVAALVRAAA